MLVPLDLFLSSSFYLFVSNLLSLHNFPLHLITKSLISSEILSQILEITVSYFMIKVRIMRVKYYRFIPKYIFSGKISKKLSVASSSDITKMSQRKSSIRPSPLLWSKVGYLGYFMYRVTDSLVLHGWNLPRDFINASLRKVMPYKLYPHINDTTRLFGKLFTQWCYQPEELCISKCSVPPRNTLI